MILMADHGQGRGIGGHGHMDWGERPVPFVVWGPGAVPGAIRPRAALGAGAGAHDLDPARRRGAGGRAWPAARAEPGALAGVAPAAGARRPSLVPAAHAPVATAGASNGAAGAAQPAGRFARPPVAREPLASELARLAAGAPSPSNRCLAIVVARNEEEAVGDVLGGLPAEACGMPVDVLLVNDGSTDATPHIAHEHGARVISHERSRGLGAALRTGLELARDEGYAAAVYLDGDGEYDPAQLARVLEPVARGRADYVLGSRFLGHREGMTWHRDLANRGTTALLGTLMRTVLSDGQTGYRAFSAAALRAARIRHDYNYAQVLTLSLWGAGIEPVEVPIDYRRRTTGRSFVRYPEYFARVAPALWREWRSSRRHEGGQREGDEHGEHVRPDAAGPEQRQQLGQRAERRVGPAGHPGAVAEPHVEVEPGRRRERQGREHGPYARGVAQPPGDQRDRQRQRREQVTRREPEAEHRRGEQGRDEQLRAERGGADGRGELDLARARQRAREPVAVRAPEQPEPAEGEQRRRAPSAAGRTRGRRTARRGGRGGRGSRRESRRRWRSRRRRRRRRGSARRRSPR